MKKTTKIIIKVERNEEDIPTSSSNVCASEYLPPEARPPNFL
jgi:hypothetical protein